MKKIWTVFLCLILLFSVGWIQKNYKSEASLSENRKEEYFTEDIAVCSTSSTKSFMSYKAITNKASRQYHFIQQHMGVDQTSGLLYDKAGFIGVALGSSFGSIGTRYYFTLDTGVVIPVVKVEEKADRHTRNGCEHLIDGSVLEFVIDMGIAKEYYKTKDANVVVTGNFNSDVHFAGSIIGIKKVLRRNSFMKKAPFKLQTI